jgi:hypothetical protein
MRIGIPILGAANVSAYTEAPEQFAPAQAMRNVVANGIGKRRRLSTRPGLVKAFPEQLAAGQPVQALAVLSRASAITGFALGDPLSLVNGWTGRAALIAGNQWIVPTGQIGTRDAMLVSGSGGQARIKPASTGTNTNLATTANFPNTTQPVWCGVDQTGTLAAWAYRWTDSGTGRVLVTFADAQTGTPLGSKVITLGAVAAPVTGAFLPGLLVIAAGVELHGVRLSSAGTRVMPGAVVSITYTDRPAVIGRYVACAGAVVGGVPTVWLAFAGSAANGSAVVSPSMSATLAQTIDAGEWGRQFRAGVVRYAMTQDSAGAWTATVVRLGGTPDEGTPLAEDDGSGGRLDHKTMRFAEWLDRSPRGCVPTGIAANPDGSFVCTFTGSGWGPNTAWTPGGHDFTTVAKFDAAGELLWEADTASIISDEEGGKVVGDTTLYVCDVPDEDGANAGTTSKAGPAIRACAMDSAGLVYVGGRIHSAGSGEGCVFCFESASGQLRWKKALTESVGKGTAGQGVGPLCLTCDRDDQRPIVCVARTKTWNPDIATEPYALAFKLDPVDGAVLWSWSSTQDQTESDLTCVASAPGRAVFGGNSWSDS